MNLDYIFNNIDSKYRQLVQGEVWREDPVTLKEFTESKYHLYFPLFPRQFQALHALVGDIPKLMFMDKPDYYSLGVLCYGKGAGKDTMASIFNAYSVYQLLCLHDPQQFLGIGPGEYIDIINVSYTEEQAKNVFFARFIQRLLRWPWLRDRYSIYLRDKLINDPGRPEVRITSNSVIFPNNIRAISENSSNESFEGYNVLVFCLDEASAFRSHTKTANADKVFQTLKTSASSRFGVRAKGLIISFPRYEDDFTIKMYNKAKEELHIFADKAATWDVNLHVKKDDPAILEDFRLNPEEARMKYSCEPPLQEDSFITYPERIPLCIDYNRPPIAEYAEEIVTDTLGNNYVAQRLTGYNIPRQPSIKKYLGWVDFSISNDATTFIVAHQEQELIIQDLILRWIPKKNKRIPISFDNVAKTILNLRDKLIQLEAVGFDQFNSASTIQLLNSKGIAAQKIRLDITDYQTLKSKLYAGTVRLLKNDVQVKELEKLRIINNTKVDHPEDGSKDIIDGLCGVVKLLTVPMQFGAHRSKHLPPPDEREDLYGEGESENAFAGIGVMASLR